LDFAEIDPDITFDAPTAIEAQHVLKRIGQVFGSLNSLRVLDLGCGCGEAAVYFAKQGAVVSACDISPKFIDVTQQLAAHHQVGVTAVVCPSEALPFADDSFDVVFANGVLHHVDIPPSMAEIRRVLKPGGRGFFIEPLPYNPIINVYRWIAREVRTPDERPLSLADIRQIKRVFPQTRVDYFWLATLGVFLYFYLIERANPSQERYWKKILYEAPRYEKLFNALKRIDDALLPNIPGLGLLCWNQVIEVHKV
jgi:SAM-dependent methyltransferase